MATTTMDTSSTVPRSNLPPPSPNIHHQTDGLPNDRPSGTPALTPGGVSPAERSRNPSSANMRPPKRTNTAMATKNKQGWGAYDGHEVWGTNGETGLRGNKGANAPINRKRSASTGSSGRRFRPLHKTNAILRGHIVATIGEFVGTIAFLFFAFAGTQVANSSSTSSGGPSAPDPQILTYVALSFGLSLLVNAWVFYRISGGLFNPAVTLAMFVTGAIDWIRAICLTIAQFLGAILASAFVLAFFPEPLNVTTTLAQGTNLAEGFFIETALTMELVFTILMLAKEKHKATFMAPIGIGLALFISELVGVYYTGGSLNPARSLGPAVVSRSFPSDHWIYWIAPCFGSLLACGLYTLIRLLDYEVGNPGQDEDSEEKAEEIAEMTQARVDESASEEV